MKMKVRGTLLLGVCFLLLGPLSILFLEGNDKEMKLDWVIGSSVSALANDGSKITLTGNGAFIVPEEPEGDVGRGGASSSAITGGGTWQTFDADNTLTGSGTYIATELVRFDPAPGVVANPLIRAGLAHIRVRYSDGSRGVLVVSCRLIGTPASVFEGAIASKGFVSYWNRIEAGAFFRVSQ